MIEQQYIKLIKTVFFPIGILLLFSCKLSERSKNRQSLTTYPNFIIVLADDQGWNGTSVKMMKNENESRSYYHETPNLELLALRGM